MQTIKLIEYGSSDYREMVQLRDSILRKPLGLHFTQAYLRQEIEDLLIGCFYKEGNDGTVNLIGCCVLSPIDEELIQLRQMAVSENWQRSGIGKQLMEFAEAEAIKNGFQIMMMHARKTAIPFYRQLGYHILGDEFLEVSIPHVEMRKTLTAIS